MGKEDKSHSPKQQGTLIITGPGGSVVVKDLWVSAEDQNSPALTVGQTYFFFLKRIPATGAYVARNTSVIVKESQKLGGLGGDAHNELMNNTDVSLELEEVRTAAKTCTERSK